MASPDVGGSTVYTSVAMSVLDQKHFYSTLTSTLLMGSYVGTGFLFLTRGGDPREFWEPPWEIPSPAYPL